jgi:uncharacterized protein
VPHRTPNLSDLRVRAQTGDSSQAVKAYLDAGGNPSTALQARLRVDGAEHMVQLPILHSMAMTNAHPHRELAESVRLLVEAGANINAAGLNAAGLNDRTTLMCAGDRRCCTKVLQVFLQNGADVLVTSSANGFTALHKEAEAGRTECCDLLLAKDNSLVHVCDAHGRTALMHAAQRGHLHIVQLLTQHGADINAVDMQKQTALIIASSQKQVKVALHLLKAGADVNAVDCGGYTALLAAAQSDCIALVQLLLNHGADISAKNKEGEDAFFKSVQQGSVLMMNLLVQRGLSVHAAANDMWDIADVCSTNWSESCC